MADKAADVMFYHLATQSLERVLPSLLEKTLARGWRAVVQSGSDEKLDALNIALWTFADESFLPHGSAKNGNAADQPIFLTTTGDTPNGAGIRFLVHGAVPHSYIGFERMIFLFDGRDEDAVATARVQWRDAKAAGSAVTYWKQTDDGGWAKKS